MTSSHLYNADTRLNTLAERSVAPIIAGRGKRPMPKSKIVKGDTAKLHFPKIAKKSGLSVLELRGSDIFQVEGVLDTVETERFIEAAESSGFKHQGSRGAAFGEAFRDNGRTAIHSNELADSLWRNTGLQEMFRDYPIDGKEAIGLNPNIRFYRYQPGNKFGKHIDESVQIGRASTKYTLLIYLSGGGQQPGQSQATAPLGGGETVFYGGKQGKIIASVTPRAGLALLHLHGDDCLEHEALQVQSGVKYVLRSDVVYG